MKPFTHKDKHWSIIYIINICRNSLDMKYISKSSTRYDAMVIIHAILNCGKISMASGVLTTSSPLHSIPRIRYLSQQHCILRHWSSCLARALLSSFPATELLQQVSLVLQEAAGTVSLILQSQQLVLILCLLILFLNAILTCS